MLSTPFAGATALCDADTPSSRAHVGQLPPGCAPSQPGGFSLRESKICNYCGVIYFRHKQNTNDEFWKVQDNCRTPACRRASRSYHDKGRNYSIALSPEALKESPKAFAVFAGVRFTDSDKAIADEGSRYIPRRPDPFSYMGCAAAMCAR